MTDINMNDGVLKATRLLLTILIWLFTAFFAVMVFIAIAMLFVSIVDGNALGQALQEQFPGIGHLMAILTGGIIAGGVVAALWLIRKFMLVLREIVDTVRSGDPFIRDNAERLRLMGWLLVIVGVIKLLLTAVAIWASQYVNQSELDLNIDSGLDIGGLLSILLLFVLAKVFERGTDMREELEGTV